MPYSCVEGIIMNLKLSAVLMAFITYIILFYTFSYYFFSTPNFSFNFPNISHELSSSYIYSQLKNMLGGSWSIGIYSLSGIENAIIYALTPFAYIFQIFYVIFQIIAWIGYFISYPFSYFPSPLNSLIPIFLGFLFTISIISSLKIIDSGVE